MRTLQILFAVILLSTLPAIHAAEGPATRPSEQEKTYPDRPKLTYLEIGDAAPDFSLPGVDGKTHKLSDYSKSDVLVVVFTCNHCPTSRVYEKPIIKLAEDYRAKNVALVAISPNDPGALRPDEIASSEHGDSFEDMKIRAKEMKFNFPYLYDGKTQKVAMAYGAVVTPHVFIFDKKRTLCYAGAVSRSPFNPEAGAYARDAIDAILAGKEVKVGLTRPFGCSVKWGFKRRMVDGAATEWNERPVKLGDVDADKVKAMAAHEEGFLLRMICVWSLDEKTCAAGFKDLVFLKRIYEYSPFELLTVNCDPSAKRKEVLAFLKKHHAAVPRPSRFRPRTEKEIIENYYFTPGDKATLFKALGQDKTSGAPCVIIVAPGGNVLYSQSKKLEVPAIRKQLVKLLSRR